MRRVTAGELHRMGVKGGPDLSLPSDSASKVALAKAQFLATLEKLYGDDLQLWIRALKQAKRRIRREPYRTALDEILKDIERKVKNG